MSRFNTGNPLGSGSPLDLDDNAKNLDEAVNSSADAFQDRLGKSRLTWAGMENQFESDQSEREVQFDAGQASRESEFNADQTSREQQFRTFIASSGYQFAGEYAAGIEITQYNQILRDENGEFWRVSGQVDLPYVTTGAGIPEDDALVPAGDAVLRQDLANPDMGAAIVARGVVAVDSIVDLLALPDGQRKVGLRYLVKGYHAGSDIGGGEFYWDASSVDSINRGTVFGGAGEGRWKRVFSGTVYVSWFGAVGDGVTDDTDAFQAAVDAHSHVRVTGRKTYLIDPRRTFIQNPGDNFYAGVRLPSGCHLVMDPDATLTIAPQSESWYGIIGCQDASNVRIEGGHLIGDRDTNTSGGGEHGYGLAIVSSENIVVNGVTASGFYGDGFFVGPANHLDASSRCVNVALIDCVADNNRRQGLSVTGCVGLTVRGGKYTNTIGTPPECGIDLEPNDQATISEDCLISGVELYGNAHSGLMNTIGKNVTIENCIFRNHPLGHLYITGQIDLIVTGCHFDSPGSLLRLRGGESREKHIEISSCKIRYSTSAAENFYLFSTPGSASYLGTLSIHNNQFMVETGTMGTLRMFQAEGNVARIQNNHFTFGSTYDSPFIYVAGTEAYRLSGNTLYNKGPNSLIPNLGAPTSHTAYDGGNTYQGLFDRTHTYFRNLGDFHVYIDTAAVASGVVFGRNMTVLGAKLGDVVTATPLAAVGVGHIQAKVVDAGSVRVTFYNFSTTAQNYSGDYAITLSRST